MKRESGESPEQSRCCEFHARCIILVHCSSERTGRRCTGNESEDLQNKVEKLSIRGKWAVRKWFKIIFIYSMSGRTKVLLVCAVSVGASIFRLSARRWEEIRLQGKCIR